MGSKQIHSGNFFTFTELLSLLRHVRIDHKVSYAIHVAEVVSRENVIESGSFGTSKWDGN